MTLPAMTPRENMIRAVEFRRPARLPVQGYGDEVNDTAWVGYGHILPPQAEAYDGPGRLDEWLCQWNTTDTPNMGQVKGHPLEDLSRMNAFPWPDGSDPRRYQDLPTALSDIESDPVRKDKYRRASIFMILWERMHSLHGFENTMVDLMDNTPEIHELADRIMEYNIQVVRSLHKLAGDQVDGFGFTEDWGTQIDLHISPELWTQFFLPRYKKLFKAIHDCGWHVWMHSCGKVNKAIPGLIEVGLDVINLQQPLTTGIEEIAHAFAGKLCFESLCDIQKTLPTDNRDAIEREAETLMRTWGTPDGGFILGDYGDHAAIGTAAETKEFMLETFQRLDPWKNGWQ